MIHYPKSTNRNTNTASCVFFNANFLAIKPIIVSLILFFSHSFGFAQSCTCTTGLNLIGSSISLEHLVTTTQLPTGGSNIACISVPANATFVIDIDYTFTGTTFNMGGGSTILVNSAIRLTLQDSCYLWNCDDNSTGWNGITLTAGSYPSTPGGELDMSNSTIVDAQRGVDAEHLSKIRLVDN